MRLRVGLPRDISEKKKKKRREKGRKMHLVTQLSHAEKRGKRQVNGGNLHHR